MKKKLLILTTISALFVSLLAGCAKNEDNKTSFVISNSNVDVAEYKGLEAEKYNVTVSDSEVDTYIEYVMNYDGVNSVDSKYSISDLTDEMVKTISGGDYDNIQDYREYIENIIKEQNLTYYEENTKNQLFETIVNNSVLKTYDKDKLQSYIDYANEYYQEYADYLGIDIETLYTETMGFNSEEEYNKYIEDESLNNLKIEYIICAIADAEKVEISDEDVQAQIQSYIDEGYFETKDDVLEYISEEEIKNNLKYYQVLDIIYNSAKFIEPETKTTEDVDNKSVEKTTEDNN